MSEAENAKKLTTEKLMSVYGIGIAGLKIWRGRNVKVREKLQIIKTELQNRGIDCEDLPP